jgi:6-phosphogluconolactonase/glucosamine-6-phosphate isomerase/deaminase
MMKFSTRTSAEAVSDIATYITSNLQAGQKVLWLISGGSAIQTQAAIMTTLRNVVPEKLVNLTVLSVDERYGEYGHGNSNSAQMRAAGFEPGGATWYDVLGKNLPMHETVSYYAELAENTFAMATTVLATLGMGPDAHTAGILPGSPAITDTTSTVVGYSWSDYERMTLGVPALLQIDAAYVLAYGESKKSALERLYKNDEPVELLPAKILYDLPAVTVYNDYIESEG